VLKALVQLQVSRALGGGPAEDDGDVVDQTGLAEFLERLFVVRDVDEDEQDAQRVLAGEAADARVDVLGVQTVVF